MAPLKSIVRRFLNGKGGIPGPSIEHSKGAARRKRPATVTINSAVFRVPWRMDLLGDAPVVTELWMVDILSRLLGDDSVFVDIGVNRAQSLLKVKAAAPGARYIGIEPMAESIAFANEVIRINELPGCSLICAALGDAEFRLLPLMVERGVRLDSMAAVSFGSRPQCTRDPSKFEARLTCCTSFDALHACMEYPSVDVVKIDVEGAERRVLEGMSNVLDVSRPFVLLEILPAKSHDRQAIEDQAQVRAILERHGYQLLRIVKDDRMRRTEGLLAPQTWPFVHGGRSKPYRDYLAVPGEKIATVRDWIERENAAQRDGHDE